MECSRRSFFSALLGISGVTQPQASKLPEVPGKELVPETGPALVIRWSRFQDGQMVNDWLEVSTPVETRQGYNRTYREDPGSTRGPIFWPVTKRTRRDETGHVTTVVDKMPPITRGKLLGC